MNILFYTKDSTYLHRRVGGAQTSIRLIAEKLAKRGNNVCYLTTGEDGSTTLEENRINGVDVIFYPRRGKRGLFYLLRKLIYGKHAAREGWREAFKALIKSEIVKRETDLIYTYYDLDGLDSLLWAAREKGIPIVLRMAGLNWYEKSKDDVLKKEQFEEAFERVDSINYNTRSLSDLVWRRAKEIGFNYQPKHEFTADIGGEVIVPSFRKPVFDEKRAFKILVATRFSSYQKRHDLLVEAVARMPDKRKLQVLLVGDGPVQSEIAGLIKRYELEEIVQIKPFMKQDDLWAEMLASDLLCHPCEYEGLSKIIVESMMMGLPVMTSNVLPVTDYVNNRDTGILVDNTVADWMEALESIVNDRSILSGLAVRAKSFADIAFDPDRNAEILEEHFNSLISVQNIENSV